MRCELSAGHNQRSIINNKNKAQVRRRKKESVLFLEERHAQAQIESLVIRFTHAEVTRHTGYGDCTAAIIKLAINQTDQPFGPTDESAFITSAAHIWRDALLSLSSADRRRVGPMSCLLDLSLGRLYTLPSQPRQITRR
jgi:hypothetical protein